jgi:hydrogenase-4 component B
MNAWLVVSGLVLAGGSGVPGLFLDRRGAAGQSIALLLLAIGSTAGMAGALGALFFPRGQATLDLRWSVPGGAFVVQVDALSAMFLLQVFAVSLLGAIYGLGYWKQADHPENGRKLRLFYGLVTAGMALLVVAGNAVLFLAGWEVMALCAFLLITTSDQDREVREVGYLYLVATRIGTLCLLAMFALLFVTQGSFTFGGPLDAGSAAATPMLLLGLVGFGIKAGLMPFHVWLPGAHASAPSHVSALMSGVLIKMGIYGLLRLTSFFPSPPLWWGGLVLGLGIASGVLGVAFAIGQHDIKRLLAYHSVENIGIICMGLGLGLIGRAIGRPELVALGLAGGLLHVWNHGLFKALLFLAAGSVVHATGTRQMDQLGGLLARMPATAVAFLNGAAAICGLPPLNGFISELLIYLGLLRAASTLPGALWLASAFSAVGLTLIGALAVACFAKALGVVFLGQPRSDLATSAHEAGASMTVPMGALAGLCVFIGLGSLLVAPVLDRAAAVWAPDLAGALPRVATRAPLLAVTAMGGVLVVACLGVGVWLGRRTRGAGALVGNRAGNPAGNLVGTWDCGYALPTARMQYTSSSFAEMLVRMFGWALRPRVHRPATLPLFPGPERFHSHVPETVLDELLLPASRAVGRGLGWFRWVQRGSVHAYLVYILATLVGLLIWQGGS